MKPDKTDIRTPDKTDILGRYISTIYPPMSGLASRTFWGVAIAITLQPIPNRYTLAPFDPPAVIASPAGAA